MPPPPLNSDPSEAQSRTPPPMKNAHLTGCSSCALEKTRTPSQKRPSIGGQEPGGPLTLAARDALHWYGRHQVLSTTRAGKRKNILISKGDSLSPCFVPTLQLAETLLRAVEQTVPISHTRSVRITYKILYAVSSSRVGRVAESPE